MKNSIIKICLLLFSISAISQKEIDNQWKNQINSVFQGMDKNRVPNEILLDYAMEFTNVPAYNGTISDSTFVNANAIGNIYKTLFMGKVTTNTQYFPRFETFVANWNQKRNSYNQTDKSTIVLAGLYYKYSKLDPNALATSKITVSGNKYYDKFIGGVWQNPYQTMQTIGFAPAIDTYNKLNFGVVLPENLFLSNATITKIEVDFNDGAGFQLLTIGQKVYPNYNTSAIYNWFFKTTLPNGTVLLSRTKVKINAPVPVSTSTQAPEIAPNNSATTINFENNVYIPYATQTPAFGIDGAILRIKYAPTSNGQIKKPFIVVEGFDAGSILTPEVEGGDRTLYNFLYDSGDLASSGNLNGLLNSSYDIIYVDWTNGTNSIQHNSQVLQNVILWVNNKKQQAGSTQKNVILGQSMGGVISRYTLAKMEHNSINHDVTLNVAHDSPLQGANTPISIQYFSRHAYDTYVNAPILYALVEVVIPTVLDMVNALSLNNLNLAIPSPEDALTIQDTPAALELNYDYVDFNSNPTKAIHQAWQQEFETMGYPTLCRNIAISNGNECATNQGFNPHDKFIALHDRNNPTLLMDLVNNIATPILGIVTSDLTLTFLGLLPGSSKYYFDFDIYSNPNLNDSSREVYFGKIRYEKKLLWIISISHTITERHKDAPYGFQPFDTYSGGYYNINNVIKSYQNYLPSNILINPKYCFIPVVSALDIKRNNNEVNPDDYLKSYAGGVTPDPSLTTQLNNFTVDFTPYLYVNNRHISFQPRNGKWLYDELTVNTVNPVYPNNDCSFVCLNAKISGVDSFCDTAIFSVSNQSTSFNWTITQGSNLATITAGPGTNTVTLTSTNPLLMGNVTIACFLGNQRCGYATVTKQIWVGAPKPTFTSIYNTWDWVCVNSGTFPMGVTPAPFATSYYWVATADTTDFPLLCPTVNQHHAVFTGGTYGYDSSGTYYTRTSPSTSPTAIINWGTCIGSYLLECYAVNDCGATLAYLTKYTTVGKASGNPCTHKVLGLKIAPNPVRSGTTNFVVSKTINSSPCNYTSDDPRAIPQYYDSGRATVSIYNYQGLEVYSNVFDTPQYVEVMELPREDVTNPDEVRKYEELSHFNIQNLDLAPGLYIIKVKDDSQIEASEHIIVE